MTYLQILAGFTFPYAFAIVAFPIVARTVGHSTAVTSAVCLIVISSSWIVPPEESLLRFLASISATMLSLKFIDVSIDLSRRRTVTWEEYVIFLTNPFTLVRRCLWMERQAPRKDSAMRLLWASAIFLISLWLLFALFKFNWLGYPFFIEHIAKVTVLMFAISSGLNGAAALWRLGGGTARDYMDRPFLARTPGEFWRRYNRNVQQFFLHNVFNATRNKRKPIRTILLVFALSAVLHEVLFLSAVGSVQGYQTAFFTVQGVAAAATARIRTKGLAAIPWTLATFAFNLVTSVLFFASIHAVTPFYSQGIPTWLQAY